MNHFWDEGEMRCNSRLEGRCVWERIGKASLGTMGKSKQCKEEGCFVCRNVFSWFLHGGFISAFDFRPRLDFKQTNCSWNKHKYGSQQPKETIHSNSIPTHCNTAFMHTKSPAVVTQIAGLWVLLNIIGLSRVRLSDMEALPAVSFSSLWGYFCR